MKDGRYTTEALTLDGLAPVVWVAQVDLFSDGSLGAVSLDVHESTTRSRRVVARMQPDGEAYVGPPLLGHDLISDIKVTTTNGELPLTIALSLTAGAPVALTFRSEPAPNFREVELELTSEQHVLYATSWSPDATAAPPPGFAELTVEGALERAGVGLTVTRSGPLVYDKTKDLQADWDSIELHDAMLSSWQHAQKSPWYVWALAATLHEEGRDLCGLMFEGGEEAGANARQGVAVFANAYLHRRMKYGAESTNQATRNQVFTLVHELGHAFNLAHSWEKQLFPDAAREWPASADDPDARSWMNYPHAVPGFWNDFAFGFSRDELRFIRHAPEEFVSMGGAPFLSNNALAASPRHPLRVEVTGRLRFSPLEPVRVAVRVTNTSKRGVVLGPATGIPSEMISPLVREGDRWRPLRPYTRALRLPGRGVILPGESRWADVFLGGEPRRGAVFREPGAHRAQVVIADHGGVLGASTEFSVEIDAPRAHERALVPGFQSESMSRLYAFGGSNVLLGRGGELAATLGQIQAMDPSGSDAPLYANLVATGAATRPRRVLSGGGVTFLRPSRREVTEAVVARRDFVRSAERAQANPALFVRVVRGQADLISRRDGREAALQFARDTTRLARPVLDDALSAGLDRMTRRIRDRIPR